MKNVFSLNSFAYDPDRPLLLSDVDGVALDWLQGFINYNAENGHAALHAKPTVFGMTDIFPTLPKPWEHIMDYQHTHHYEGLKAYDDTKQVYNRLFDMGVQIIFVSSCGTSDFIRNTRIEVLEREFDGKFDDVVLLDLGASKTEVLKKYPQAAWVEDQLKVALEGTSAGHKAYLRNMPYNNQEDHPDVTRLMTMNTLIKDFSNQLGISKSAESTGLSL